LKTAVVTGVAGFIGSSLAEKLLKENFKVVGIDCFTDYYSKNIKKKNLTNCLKNEHFTFIQKNILELDLEPIIKNSQCLFHQAAQPGVRASWGSQFDTYVKDNILVTQKILESAKEVKTLEKIVMASSSSVYGNQEGKMIEESTLTKPISPYGATKLAAENLGNLYAENFDLPVISLRYFTVYGPRQRPDMAFSKFIRSNISSKGIEVFGDGNQIRDFTYISDIVEANILSMNSSSKSGIFNIGGGSTHSVNQILEMIKNITGNENIIKFKPKQNGDVFKTESDIEKARKNLNYSPKIDIKKGLENQFQWILNNSQ
jgi:nucleoside-diphosphate-sugar epimerase